MNFKEQKINGDTFIGITIQNGAALQFVGSFRPDMIEFIYLNHSDYIQIRAVGMIIAFDPRMDTWEAEE